MSRSPSIETLARGVCVKQGHLLLCHTKGAKNTYLPGGHVEFNEKAKVSLQREMMEELGLTARVGRFLGVVEHAFIQNKVRHCEINLVFLMQLPGITPARPVKSHEDYIEFLWIPLNRLGKSKLEPAVLRKILPGWLKATPASAPYACT